MFRQLSLNSFLWVVRELTSVVWDLKLAASVLPLKTAKKVQGVDKQVVAELLHPSFQAICFAV